MKLNPLPLAFEKSSPVQKELAAHAQQVNLLSEGRMAARHNAQTSPPTTGTHAQGDFVPNSAPEELGSASSKYVVAGWQYVDVGAGVLDWVERRFLTGN